MCELVENSNENIHWGTSTDIGSLYDYREKHGSLKGLVRAGLTVIWTGIESKADYFNKRNKATQQDVEEIIKELKSLGIMVIGSYIVGLPIHTEGETIMDTDGTYKKLNINEDIRWWIGLNTESSQVMMYTKSILSKGKNAFSEKVNPEQRTSIDLLGVKDSEYAHLTVNNTTDIPDKKLEEFDKFARKALLLNNGPTVLRTLMTWWDGFMALKDSENFSEKRTAVYNYWTVKRYFQLVSFGTVLFSETFFEKFSDEFQERFAKFLSEVDTFQPPDCELNSRYKKLFDKQDSQVSPIATIAAEFLRNRFIQKVNSRKQAKLELAPQAVLFKQPAL